MKKYILILFSVFAFGQSGLIARQNFAYKAVSTGTNTEIGGVAATISTPALLAAKLGISVGNISNFSIVGSDIKCKITGSYAIPANAFQTTPNTFYNDIDGLVTSLGAESFKNNTLKWVYFKNCTSVGSGCFSDGSGNVRDFVYIPNCTNLGGTSGDNSVFAIGYQTKIIYVNPSLATNNAGAPDGDLAYAISQGSDVRYVANFTAPNAITDLAAGTIYNTAIQLNFTPPSSTNAIDYYECYVNGAFKNKITTSGQYITGLTASTNYNIVVYAVDIFLNKSLVSNNVNQSTNTTDYLGDKVIAAYPLSSAVDVKNGYNGMAGAAVTYVSGVNANAANFNATSNSYISIPDNNDFSFTNGTNDSPFSVSLKVKLTSNTLGFLVAKTSGGFATNLAEWSIYNNSGSVIVLLSNKTTGYLGNSFSTALTTGVWYDIVVTYDGSGTNAGMKLYLNGVSKSYSTTNSGVYTSMQNTASLVTLGQEKAGAGLYPLNGIIDECYIFNYELTATEAIYLQTNYYPF